MSKLFKVIQGNSSQEVGLLQGLDPKGSVKALVDTHFPGNVEYVPKLPSMYTIATKDIEEVKFIDVLKVKHAIGTFGPKKAPGPDGIAPKVLQSLNNDVLAHLTVVYKASIALGYVPKAWRTAKVVFIPKPGKDAYDIPKAFRPISLTSFLFKTLERIMLMQIESTALRENPLNQNQHAFRKGSSCDSALSSMVDDVERAILRDEYALGAFLDIAGAFDNLDPVAAVRGMHQKHIQPEIIRCYQFYLFNRSITTEVKGIKIQRGLTKGTPQGGVLSPVVWNLAFDGLLDLYKEGPVGVKGFADDAALLVIGPDPNTLKQLIQPAISKAIDWGRRNGLTFGPSKTELVLFSRKRS